MVIWSIMNKVRKMCLQRLPATVITKLYNMLLKTTAGYTVLLGGYQTKQLSKCDKKVITLIIKKLNIEVTDTG